MAPFSARAQASAGVSMPLRWDELTSRLRNERFTIKNAVRRMRSLKSDPWAGFLGHHADLPRVLDGLAAITRTGAV